MELDELKDLLPNPEDDPRYTELKEKHPYYILHKYAKVFQEKYPSKLFGAVTESKDVVSENLLSYALYVVANIGNGYSYRLLEVRPQSIEMYPLEITVFERKPKNLNNIEDAENFETVLQDIFKSDFTRNLVLNLLNQVELYNESREDN